MFLGIASITLNLIAIIALLIALHHHKKAFKALDEIEKFYYKKYHKEQ